MTDTSAPVNNEEQNNTESAAQTEEVPAAAAPAINAVEEEEKKEEESKEESKTNVLEVAPDANLSEIFVNLDDGVPSDVIPSLCMDCKE